jgi:peptide/nickel transport system substrate-binding protein
MGNMVFSAPWRRWLSVMLALISAIALSSCSPAQHKTQAAQIPQLVVATLSDPKTFNYALSSESPNVFGYIYEGLVAENGLTGALSLLLPSSGKSPQTSGKLSSPCERG